MAELTVERLKELLRYDPETGHFWWRVQRGGRGRLDVPAGGLRELGYRTICIDGRNHRAHRLAWLYVTGSWPVEHIDHRFGITDDNRFSELREATPRINAQNTRTSGVEHRPGKPLPWRARIWVEGRNQTIGSFATEGEAKAARRAAKLRLHPGYIAPIVP